MFLLETVFNKMEKGEVFVFMQTYDKIEPYPFLYSVEEVEEMFNISLTNKKVVKLDNITIFVK